MGERLIYAVDLGGTNLRAGLVDPSGRVVAGRKTPPRGDRRPAVFLKTLAELLEELVAESGGKPDALVLAVPGPMDAGRGWISSPVNVPDLGEAPLAEMAYEALGLPVTLVNDATAFALGEYWRGAARGHPWCLGVTLGTGVGGGAVLDGRPLLGVKGNALEIGHLTVEPGGRPCNCGRRGCLEAYASASAVRRRAMELAKEGRLPDLLAAAGGDTVNINSRLITEHARGGDRVCAGLLEEAGLYLGRGLALAQALLDVDLAVVGGGLAGAGELILGPARESLDRHRFRTPTGLDVVTGELGGDAGLIGASALALNLF
ncbi:MAG TPA: ROK family protein [bacterium]|nr:ROK family protein [bacterium]